MEIEYGSLSKLSNIGDDRLYFQKDFILTVTNFEKKSKPYFFMLKDENKFCLFLFIKREIPIRVDNQKYYDLITPYDYGGFSYNSTELFTKFFNQFDKFCKKENIISAFWKFNPMYNFHFSELKKFIDIRLLTPHIYIDLAADYKSGYSKRKKRNINNAKRYDYQFVVEDNIDNFFSIYTYTMKLRNAHKYYFFEKQNLQELMNFGKVFTIKYHDDAVTSIFILEDQKNIYYFLGGSKDRKYGFNSLLFDLVSDYYKKHKRNFLLGGGQNGIYQYKKEFSKLEKPFYIGKKIFNNEVYYKLVQLTKRGDNEFFPKYREKII